MLFNQIKTQKLKKKTFFFQLEKKQQHLDERRSLKELIGLIELLEKSLEVQNTRKKITIRETRKIQTKKKVEEAEIKVNENKNSLKDFNKQKEHLLKVLPFTLSQIYRFLSFFVFLLLKRDLSIKFD